MKSLNNHDGSEQENILIFLWKYVEIQYDLYLRSVWRMYLLSSHNFNYTVDKCIR